VINYVIPTILLFANDINNSDKCGSAVGKYSNNKTCHLFGMSHLNLSPDIALIN
jgi:hypothetical protein